MRMLVIMLLAAAVAGCSSAPPAPSPEEVAQQQGFALCNGLADGQGTVYDLTARVVQTEPGPEGYTAALERAADLIDAGCRDFHPQAELARGMARLRR